MIDHRQELFDKVSKHLLTQMEKAIDSLNVEFGPCVYKTESGLSCAVGCLIDDDNYSPELEGEGIAGNIFPERAHMVRTAVQRSLGYELAGSEVDFLRELQAIHDTAEPENWFMLLKKLAVREGLMFNKDHL